MLQNLPLEIIILISRYLDCCDRFKLIKTCRRVHEVISRSTLHEEFRLFKHDVDNRLVVKSYEKRPDYGSRVKLLGLHTKSLDIYGGFFTHVYRLNESRDKTPPFDNIFDRLPTIFPNVTKFSVLPKGEIKRKRPHYNWWKLTWGRQCQYEKHECNRIDKKRLDKQGLTHTMINWIKNFESYDDQLDWCVVWYCLEKHTLPRLLEFHIDGEFHSKVNEKSCDMAVLLPYLNNAPSITTLDLTRCNMDLEILENIHECCPHIKSLTLGGCSIDIKNGALPQSIKPANGVLLLSMRHLLLVDKNCVFLDYILLKYPALQRLVFLPRFKIDYDMQTIDEEELEFNSENHYSYRENGAKFLPNLPKSLNMLSIDDSLFDEMYSLISESNVQLFNLDLQYRIDFYQDADQLEYLRKQIHLKRLSARFAPWILDYSDSFISTTVTKLDLCLDGVDTGLGWVLSMFPSLEVLSLKSNKFKREFAPRKFISKSQKTHRNLLFLDISKYYAYPSTFKYIKAVAPNLRKLWYPLFSKAASKERKIPHEGDQTIDFTNCNLHECTLFIKHSSTANYRKIVKNKKNPLQLRVFELQPTLHKIYCGVTQENSYKEFIIPSNNASVSIALENNQYNDVKGVKNTKIPEYLTKMDIICDNTFRFEQFGDPEESDDKGLVFLSTST